MTTIGMEIWAAEPMPTREEHCLWIDREHQG